MSLEIRITPYMMYGLVALRYIILPTNLLNSVGSTFDPSSSMLNFNLVITSFGDALQLAKLNLFKIPFAYLDCDINIPLSDC